MFHAVTTEGGRVRADAGVRRWVAGIGAMLALALVSTGLVVPTALADVGEDSTVVAPADARWWRGQTIRLEVSVTRDGAPATGDVRWLEDGWGSPLWRVPLVDGRATVVIPTAGLASGHHVYEVRHVDPSAVADPVTRQWPALSSDTVEIELADPARPVVDPTTWYYGDEHQLRFDLTGTDEPREGTVSVALADGVDRSAPLMDGVATFALDGTEVSAGTNLKLTHTGPTGAHVSSWSIGVYAKSKPVTVTATMPSAVRVTSQVVIPVRVTSSHGTPSGRVYVERGMDDDDILASATLVDGRATLRFPASLLPLGNNPLVVRFNGTPEYEQKSRSSQIDVRRRATSVAVSTPKTWTYGKARRVAVAVSSPGVTATGRVELWWDGRKVRSATLSRGKASLYVPATRVDAGRQGMVVKYVGPSTFERSQKTWTQKVAEARPKVTFRMDRTSFPADWWGHRSVRATVKVKTTGLPERGKLCLWSRDPHGLDDTWTGCWTNWSWKVDDGWRTIRVPGVMLQGSRGKSYLKLEYIPKDGNVRQVFSNTITLRHTAP